MGKRPDVDQQRESAIFRDQQSLYVDSFLEAFSFSERRPYANAITTGSRSASAVRGAIAAGLPTVTTKEAWYQAATVRIDAFREIERQLGAQIATRAEETSTQAWIRAGISAAAVLVVLALTFAMATYVARSIVGPLSRLREAALDTAARGLPGLVDRIRQDGPAVARHTRLAVTPEGKDEIGQVANAFNDVQKTAVEVASDQALLRQNLDTIVVNLSCRTQSLVDRQLGEIEGLESRERDPEQLSTLFRIDHMATRVRRHAESLLVLAGVEEMRKHGAATPVLDVVRTAVGEVEQYPRVKFGVMPTDLVASVGVDDVAVSRRHVRLRHVAVGVLADTVHGGDGGVLGPAHALQGTPGARFRHIRGAFRHPGDRRRDDPGGGAARLFLGRRRCILPVGHGQPRPRGRAGRQGRPRG